MVLWLFASMIVPRPHAAAVRIPSPPLVDGRVDDRVWEAVPAIEEFVQKFPDEGKPPTEETRVKLAYDDRALYVAVDCHQASSPVVARLTRRDRPVESDSVEIDLDTKGDGRSAFSFGINAAGVLYDSLRFDDTDQSTDWDDVWEGRAAVTSSGWSAEMAIPLRILRFSAGSAQEWGLQIRRHISARQETDEWSYIARTEGGEVSRYGRIGPFGSLAPGSGLELSPFLVGEVLRRDAVPGLAAFAERGQGNAGLDARWHMSPSFTLDATANPDFGQVEADQLVLNLTTYETFYPEKRPFFLDGVDVFSTPVQLLYTRRIGHVPDIPVLPVGETLVEPPSPVPIWGAAKITGRTTGGTTVGSLSAVTGPEDVASMGFSGGVGPRLADPPAAFQVLRLKQELDDQTSLGLFTSAAVRDESPSAWPWSVGRESFQFGRLCPDGNVVSPGGRCTHDAYVGGLDGRWRSSGDDYVVAGQLFGSHFEGGPPRFFRDGTVVSGGDSDLGGILTAAKEGGKHWIWDAELAQYGRRFDPNDLGYLERQNVRHYALDLGWRDTEANSWSRERRTQLELYRRDNLDGLDLGTGYQINERGQLDNFWQFFVELHLRTDHFDDRELGNGIALERAGLLGLETALTTDPRKMLVLDLSTQTQRKTNGWNEAVDFGIETNLHPQLGLGLLLDYTYTDGEPRFVGGSPGDWIFGRQKAESFSTTLRATWTFTSALTLQAYAQLFAAYAHYDEFSSYGGNGTLVRLSDLTPTSAPLLSPDFQEGALNADVVLRWEYRLGSTLYLVYSRASAPLVDLAGRPAGLDLAGAPVGPATDALLLKLSYWWG